MVVCSTYKMVWVVSKIHFYNYRSIHLERQRGSEAWANSFVAEFLLGFEKPERQCPLLESKNGIPAVSNRQLRETRRPRRLEQRTFQPGFILASVS